jgi:Domain of unknown function (DUF4124)
MPMQSRWFVPMLMMLAPLLLATVPAASPALAASSESATAHKVYKWIDKDGQVHYGDQIPPEYVKQEREIINSQGVEVSRLEAQKSAEQVAAEEQRSREQAAQRERDHNLLSTYVSVQEIERLRDQRLTLVADQIKVTLQFLDQLAARQLKLRTLSMHFKPYSTDSRAQKMPDQLAEDLVRTVNDIRAQRQNLHQKREEETTMRKEFTADIERFRELRGNR